VEVDIRVPVGRPLAEIADVIARCEDAGFDGVGVHDHPHSGRDAYLVLALAAERTRRIRLYPATSSPIVRHPMLLASLAHSLDELAPGRVCLTIAPGFLSARSVGRPRATVATMREAVLALRRLLAGEPVAFGDPPSQLWNLSAAPPSVYLLAAGPRMVELAGEVADGVFLMVGLHRDAVAAARRLLEAGASRAARSLHGFRTVFIATMGLEEGGATAHRWPRRWFAPGHPWLTYPSASNLHWLREAGLPVPETATPDDVSEDLAARISDAFGLFGSPEHCADRLLRAREEAGVEHIFLFPAHTLAGAYEMPEREIEAFRRVIRPRLGGGPQPAAR
jgi:5,10-methylenetetrahydromethanopterin reductase